jgi:chromosome segregation ATPase
VVKIKTFIIVCAICLCVGIIGTGAIAYGFNRQSIRELNIKLDGYSKQYQDLSKQYFRTIESNRSLAEAKASYDISRTARERTIQDLGNSIDRLYQSSKLLNEQGTDYATKFLGFAESLRKLQIEVRKLNNIK